MHLTDALQRSQLVLQNLDLGLDDDVFGAAWLPFRQPMAETVRLMRGGIGAVLFFLVQHKVPRREAAQTIVRIPSCRRLMRLVAEKSGSDREPWERTIDWLDQMHAKAKKPAPNETHGQDPRQMDFGQ